MVKVLGLGLRCFTLQSSLRRVMASGVAVAAGSGEEKSTWQKPQTSPPAPVLKVYNSLTRTKEEFVPLSGRRVLWYSCGPTVYDASHMGHARSYITFDILRRVFSEYFQYDILYVMNITDIDDKIIKRARCSHLYQQYLAQERPMDQLTSDLTDALQVYRSKAESELDADKKAMMMNMVGEGEKAVMRICSGCVSDTELEKEVEFVRDPLSSWLDSKLGSSVTDLSIFSKLSQLWEEEFHKDMAALNVLPADVLTRVSEYVPEVIEFTQKIVDNGYGYESNGSVYFDVQQFRASPNHHYAKLMPEAVGDSQAMAEGEGVLSSGTDRLKEKRHRNDFVLWKASKSGEPSWPSPWGRGRPGWHIECSVMACDILGEKADIHTGGVDLKFPHHDNEIAQAEACYGHNQWMSYFLHSGHLTIEGCKMSKSLKNFITIKTALQQYSGRQLRLAFLLHQWNATLDYGEKTMAQALSLEKMFSEFFLRVKDVLRHHASPTVAGHFLKFQDREKQLNQVYQDTRSAVHAALCDSIDTLAVMRHLKNLIRICNVYLNDQTAPPNCPLVETMATYCTKMLQMFGVIPSESRLGFSAEEGVEGGGVDVEGLVVPFASLLADFREEVRSVALQDKSRVLLEKCDKLRDEHLPALGVLLDDRENRTAVKYVGKEAALKERRNMEEALEEKRRLKEENRRKEEEARLVREAAAAIDPREMFRDQTDKFSQFDEQGVPTHNAQGEPLTDSQKKKFRKQWQAQDKKHQQHLARLQKAGQS